MFLLFPDPKYPGNPPARFARRIAWIYYVLLFLDVEYPKILQARFVRRIASFP